MHGFVTIEPVVATSSVPARGTTPAEAAAATGDAFIGAAAAAAAAVVPGPAVADVIQDEYNMGGGRRGAALGQAT